MSETMNLIEGEISSFNRKGLTMIKQMLKDLLLSFVRPLATMTEVLYRRDLGERYFALWNVIVGVFWLILASIPLTPFRHFTYDYYDAPVSRRWNFAATFNIVVGVLWLIAFLWACWRERQSLHRRYREGIVWHSYSHGTSFLDDRIPETYHGFIVLGFGALIAYLGAYVPGGLLIVSGYLSNQMRANEMTRFHHQVLDALDARIESENLSTAIMQRSRPQNTEGFTAPLPAYVSVKFRERFIQKAKVA